VALRIGITFGDRSRQEPYLTAVRTAGLAPVSISPGEPRDSLEALSGLVLSGGADWGDQADRDQLEARLLREALERDIPVFGICRGLQVMNRVGGGTLFAHIGGHRNDLGGDRNVRHRVRAARGSRLCAIVGEELETNSRHHQAIEALSPEYRLTALAADGVREGIEREDRAWVLGVQWHPEDLLEELPHRRLFESFAEAVVRAAQQGR
jgi:gamma-glutamyl-gamma-aminobutyrate hydrolase PuuD